MLTSDAPADRQWYITSRWQQYEGELRANLLRIVGVGVFYGIHLWSYYSSQGKAPNWGLLQIAEQGTVGPRFHALATLLALAWAAAAAAVHLALRNRLFPRWISAASTAVDLLLLTCVLCIASGPRSPLVAGFFVILAMASLRMSLPLMRFATVGAIVGYFCTLGVAKWPATFGGDPNVDLTVPRYHELIVFAALTLTGVVLGQTIRRVRQLAQQYARRTTRKLQEPT